MIGLLGKVFGTFLDFRQFLYGILQLQTSKEDANPPAPATVSQIPTPIATSVKVPVNPALSYVTLASFSWDQDNDKVKVTN